MRIKRLARLVAAAVLALAVTAGTASAGVLDADGDPYVTPDDIISGSTLSGATLSNGFISMTCDSTFTATLDNFDADANTGTEPEAGITDVTFQNCSPSATIAVNNLPYSFHVTEPTITITSAGGVTINAAGVFHCTASWTAGEIVGDIDWDADTITFDDETLTMTGTGCGSTAPWTAPYGFTPDLHWG